jgi:hypothetical protein
MLAPPRLGLPAVAALFMSVTLPITSAGALPASKPAIAAASSAAIRVHHDSWDDDWDRPHYRYYHHRDYYRGEVVDAPFAHVETGRHVIVDAPFTHVYVGPRGHHIVAPFVDLWVPY